MADQKPNRRQRRAQQAMQRKTIARKSTRRVDFNSVEVPEGVMVLLDETIEHPLFGEIQLVVDENMQQSAEMHNNVLLGARRIPRSYDPPHTILETDRAVQFYIDAGFPTDHAQEMAGYFWGREARDVRNSAGFLVLFDYVDFVGVDAPEDPDWQDEAEMARYGLPARPVIMKLVPSERKLLWIRYMLRTGATLTDSEEAKLEGWLTSWETDGAWIDDSGEVQTKEPTLPTFTAKFMAVMEESGNRVNELTLEGAIDGDEPVDPAGFQGVDADRGGDAKDDADGEASV